MKSLRVAHRVVAVLLLSCGLLSVFTAPLYAQESPAVLKFFFFDSGKIEWVVSDDKSAFDEHLGANEDSKKLFDGLVAAASGDEPATPTRSHMSRWIARQREQFDEGSMTATQFRKSEGVVAYLRAHGFSADRLVDAIRERTGASAVQIVAVHRRSQQRSLYWLKVVPVNPKIELGRKGYNIEMSTTEVGYVSVIYALGLALYEVEEVVTENSPPEELPSPEVAVPDAPESDDDT